MIDNLFLTEVPEDLLLKLEVIISQPVYLYNDISDTYQIILCQNCRYDSFLIF